MVAAEHGSAKGGVEAFLGLDASGTDARFSLGRDLQGAFEGAFGGVVAACALTAARREVGERRPISLDCRFLPNPHWVEELRPQTGLDPAVRDYVMAQPEADAFFERVDDLLAVVLPGYAREGRTYLSIAVGCTGGRHRSVVVAEEIADLLRRHGYEPTVSHRDVSR